MPTYPETPLYRSITSGSFPIIVSLPRHDLDLARAALDGGASAIKVHLNAHHRASGTTFGSYTEERAFLEALAKFGAPMLVMAGQETVPTLEEMNALADLGFVEALLIVSSSAKLLNAALDTHHQIVEVACKPSSEFA
jgi:hypothetical protein